MFSADDIYPRLHRFQTQLQQTGKADRPLYFAKVDVQSCFDSIPQKPLLRLLDGLLGAEMYTVASHIEARAPRGCNWSDKCSNTVPKSICKFVNTAHADGQEGFFSEHVVKKATNRLGTVFVDKGVWRYESRAGILSLLRDHVERNIVQIGKKYCRQVTGIPQGSVVSSLLCNFFYAELEEKMLSFVNDGESLLLRLIDDFLLISTDRSTATRFVQLMHNGFPEYGLTIKREKTKVNFDVRISDRSVSRLPAATNFPYCGHAINTVNLNITRDEMRRQQNSKPP